MKLLLITINMSIDTVIANKYISFLFLIAVICIFVYVFSNTKSDK